MIVRLSDAAPPVVDDVDRLDRLHAECSGDPADMWLGELCSPGPDADHVWLDVARLRADAAAQSDDDGFAAGFDTMIRFAAANRWLNDDATHVRAHVEQAAP